MGGLIDNVPAVRDFNVSFSIEDVKSAMNKLNVKSIKLKIKNKNDVFNSYSMEMVDGLTIVRPTIQLKKISDTETNIIMNCILREGNMISQNELLDKYFNLLSVYLSKDDNEILEYLAVEKKLKSDDNRVTNVVILVIIIMFFIFLFFISKWSPFYS